MKKYLKTLVFLLVIGLFVTGQQGCTGCGIFGDTVKPTVAILSPSNGSTVSGEVTIQVQATDNAGVAKVEFYIDDSKVGEDTSSPYEYSWNTDQLQYNSTHTIQAKAYDNAGNIGVSPIITVTIGDPNVPQVTITNPQDGGIVSGTVLIQAQATDRNKKPKAPSGIQKVEFYIDDSKVGEDTSSPYEYSWDTDQFLPGSQHTIQAKAYDNAGNVGVSSIITVTISSSRKKWNFIVYMDGDNNLEQYAILDLNEMEMVGSTNDVNVIVIIDRIPGYDTSNDNWDTTRLYYVTQDSDPSTINSILLDDLGECDMSDPTTLRDFIIYCQEIFPADKTCLTLWNHGGGVYPKTYKKEKSFKPSSPIKGGLRGICWDDTTGTGLWGCLTTDEVETALREARTQTGKKIDVINMDACMCQMLEIAYEWRSEADFLTGSEETVPGYGNDYSTVLTHLTGNPDMSSQDLARTLVDDYYNYYNASGLDTTYSYINLGAPFTNLVNSFTDFASALNNTTDLEGVYNAWLYTTYFTWSEINDLYDFADELTRCSNDSNVRVASSNLKLAIEQTIYSKTTGFFGPYFPAYGIAVLIPDSDTWPYYSGPDQYVTLRLSQDTLWDEFILRFVDYTNSL